MSGSKKLEPPDKGGGGDVLGVTGRVEFLWKVIGRYDVYIGATNTKAAMLLTLNLFVIGTIALKWNEVSLFFSPFRASLVFGAAFVFLAAAAALVSSWFSLAAINPLLRSPKTPQKYHSLVFFGHVAEFEEPGGYVEAVRAADFDRVVDDLARQANALAKIAACKYGLLQWATRAVLFVQLPAVLGMIVTLLVAGCCRHFLGGQ